MTDTLLSNPMSHLHPLPCFAWPDLEAPDDTALQTRWIADMRAEVRQMLCDGLNRTAYARLLARKGHALPASLRLNRPSVPLPADRSQGGPVLVALCYLVEWAMELVEARAFTLGGEGRHRLLMLAFSRLSWLDGLLVQSYGEACSLLVWNAALDALLP